MMHHITSTNNQQIKDWKKLLTRREREKKNRYLIEGYHLVEEALKYRADHIQHIMVREDVLEEEDFSALDVNENNLTVLSEDVAKEISDTETSQGIYAELAIEKQTFPKEITGPFLLVDAVQDPGNVGTMIRTADAAGFQGVFLGKGTVDLYNSKTLRAAQGSHFHLEIYEGVLEDFMIAFKSNDYPILGTALNLKASSYKELSYNTPFALVVGNEGAGIRPELLGFIDQNVYIPMRGQAESLNVAIAASLLMFQLNE